MCSPESLSNCETISFDVNTMWVDCYYLAASDLNWTLSILVWSRESLFASNYVVVFFKWNVVFSFSSGSVCSHNCHRQIRLFWVLSFLKNTQPSCPFPSSTSHSLCIFSIIVFWAHNILTAPVEVNNLLLRRSLQLVLFLSSPLY